MDESTEDKANVSPPPQPPYPADIDVLEKVKLFGGDSPREWVDNAVEQTLIAPRIILGTLESAISATTFRLRQIKSTSIAHLITTFDSLQDLKSKFNIYEDIMLQKMKESFCFAVAHPFATSGVVFGSGFLSAKRTRRGLYYNTLRLFLSEEAMLSRATAKAQKLRDSVRQITVEGQKLEQFTLRAESELKRGRKKLRQTGKQIQGVISSTYKIERQSGGLKDILKELPKMDASQFRSEVSELAFEAMRERRVLNKEVRKISNYGIPI
ncbi:uncharacterized protein LOC111884327 [Lactuca sativa]|uniref:Uncharacterized protein n=1 Tax=Lactuca sativa TaxID=4236 RepID=A0A9R1XPH6_LACSA|nr:uncharacterized protein LOC111884327 [Lactuca sativa]KAJ0214862.1 hypothetical protein LSAT_V11C300153280 [Lactuca sativa]